MEKLESNRGANYSANEIKSARGYGEMPYEPNVIHTYHCGKLTTTKYYGQYDGDFYMSLCSFFIKKFCVPKLYKKLRMSISCDPMAHYGKITFSDVDFKYEFEMYNYHF